MVTKTQVASRKALVVSSKRRLCALGLCENLPLESPPNMGRSVRMPSQSANAIVLITWLLLKGVRC